MEPLEYSARIRWIDQTIHRGDKVLREAADGKFGPWARELAIELRDRASWDTEIGPTHTKKFKDLNRRALWFSIAVALFPAVGDPTREGELTSVYELGGLRALADHLMKEPLDPRLHKLIPTTPVRSVRVPSRDHSTERGLTMPPGTSVRLLT